VGPPGMRPPTEDTENVDNVAHMQSLKDKLLLEAESNPELKAQLSVAAAKFNTNHVYGNANNASDYSSDWKAPDLTKSCV
jgi:hypothetical protein